MPYAYSGDYSGDPGLFSTLGRIGGSIAKAVVPGWVSSAATVARGIVRPGRQSALPAMPFGGGMPSSGSRTKSAATTATGGRRRRMNVANPKALRRAIRREQGFVKLAKRSLKGTGYKIVTASSRAKKTVIHESGAGSVITH